MKKVYASVPDERTLRREVARIARELSVPQPNLVLWSRGDGRYDFASHTIYLPAKEWQEEYDPFCTGTGYWNLVLHEFAHHLDEVWCDGEGHSPEMYALYYGLVLREGLPFTEETLGTEVKYKPRSSRQGARLAGTSILADFKGVV